MTDYPVETDVIRFKLATMMPYFSHVIYRLRPVPTKGLKTFGVDATYHWYFDPDGVPFDPEGQVAVLFHEINHLLRDHHARRIDRDPKQWNVAGDCEINDWWPNSLSPPDSMMVPSLFDLPDGDLAEFYYDRINQIDTHTRVDATAMHPGKGACETPGCDSKNKDVQWKKDKDHNIAKKGVIHVPKCGGAAGNGDSIEDDGVNELEAESIRRAVAGDVEERAKARGDIPGSLERWAKELLHPTVPWNKLLKTAAHRASIIIAGSTDLTYSRPARRSLKPFILPKRIAHRTVAAFYVDTSGSMNNEEIAAALTEVRGALRSNLVDITVNFVDAEVYQTHRLTNPAEVARLRPEGGGGTDMRLCYDHAKTHRPKPNLVVVLTDGATPWPQDKPRGALHIIVLSKNGKDAVTPEWAKRIVIGGE